MLPSDEELSIRSLSTEAAHEPTPPAAASSSTDDAKKVVVAAARADGSGENSTSSAATTTAATATKRAKKRLQRRDTFLTGLGDWMPEKEEPPASNMRVIDVDDVQLTSRSRTRTTQDLSYYTRRGRAWLRRESLVVPCVLVCVVAILLLVILSLAAVETALEGLTIECARA